ncbi:putative inner membrane transporter YedA [Methylobacterium crusticola]|uniref:Inner membrane transporter YedA n=1 Tax=Methylobacterium crusticola TaxID=1697972 RepID=A0ABQ4R7Y2_9HYPH|nr:EamA family transporter [Methylobacterium crusticola]GJD53339.1 putative inner membrane transporter YedA [Methylobacterium crusticola]
MDERNGAGAGRMAAFALMALIWGLTWLPMKLASEVVPPIFLAATRFALAGLCYAALVRARGVPLGLEQPGRVVAASLLISTGCYGLVFWGVARSPTGLSAIVNLALLPIFVILVGALYGQEQITARRLGAIGLGIAGLVLLFSGRVGTAQDGALLGLGAVAAGTLSYAWGAVVSRPLMRTMHPLALAFWETSLGALGLVPVSLLVEGYDPARFAALADGRALLGLGVLVLGGSLCAFSIYLWLVRDWGAFRAGLYAFVSPIVAVGVGVAVAHEAFGWPEALGMGVMLAATALALTEGGRLPGDAA